MAFEREQKGMAAALHAFDQVGAAEAHEALAGAREVVQDDAFGLRWRRQRRRRDVVAEAVAGQFEGVNVGDDVVGKEAGVLLIDIEGRGAGHAHREVGAASVLEGEIFAPVFRVGLGVVLLDKAAGATDEVKAHQFAPVVGMLGLFEGGERVERGLVLIDKPSLADLGQ